MLCKVDDEGISVSLTGERTDCAQECIPQDPEIAEFIIGTLVTEIKLESDSCGTHTVHFSLPVGGECYECDRLHDAAIAYALNPSSELLDEAVNIGLPLAYAVARRFRGRGIDLDDLNQVAALAMVDALRRFDAERGLRFSTFAMPTITGRLRNYIRDKADILRSPRTLREQGIKMDRANAELTQKLHREPSVKELADYLGWDIEQVLDIETMRDS